AAIESIFERSMPDQVSRSACTQLENTCSKTRFWRSNLCVTFEDIRFAANSRASTFLISLRPRWPIVLQKNARRWPHWCHIDNQFPSHPALKTPQDSTWQNEQCARGDLVATGKGRAALQL